MEYERIGEKYAITPDAGMVLAAIKRFGFYQLGGGDGCSCGRLLLSNIHIEVKCPKVGGIIRVYCHYMGWNPDNGRLIAEEVARQSGRFGTWNVFLTEDKTQPTFIIEPTESAQ